MYEKSIRDEFTHQTDAFARSPAMTAAATLGSVVEMVPADGEARWLETACGPGIVARGIAVRVGSVQGVDLTPAMVEKAGAEAVAAGLGNVEFSVGDATALELEDDSFDGAVNRFSLHHIPLPQRVLEEMARVVRPGGYVVLADHLADADGDAAAWHEEIERLRDPSHWACLTRERLLAAGEAAGLVLDEEQVIPLDLDFGEWLGRGSGGPGAGEARRLLLRNSVTRWRRV